MGRLSTPNPHQVELLTGYPFAGTTCIQHTIGPPRMLRLQRKSCVGYRRAHSRATGYRLRPDVDRGKSDPTGRRPWATCSRSGVDGGLAIGARRGTLIDMTATRPTSGDIDTVQLGQVEVDARLLERAAGAQLWDLTGQDWEPMAGSRAQALQQVPVRGWRQIAGSPDSGSDETYAAPHPDDDQGWLLASFFFRDGDRKLDLDVRSHRPAPGRATRRAGLKLTWPESATAMAGTIPDLTIDLTNTSEHDWINHAEDTDLAYAWLLDDQGQRLPAPRLLMFSYHEPIPTLVPNQTLTMPVSLATSGVDQLPAGVYGITAMLTALNLSSDTGTLTLTA